MTISDFINDIRNKKCPKLVDEKEAKTINFFFDDCIKGNMLSKEILGQWHNLLMKYYEDPEAIFFIRRYASTKTKDGEWNIRRGFLTKYVKSNKYYFQYTFVDNFFAHYFYAMAVNDFCPEYDDFKGYITSFEMPYGYMVIEKELKHQAFKKGKIYPLNINGWKLSHIYSANGNDYNYNYRDEKNTLFPIGKYDDFVSHEGGNVPFRIIEEELSEEDIKKIKAHFLRVVHPINYFLTPSPKHQLSSNGIKDIGECNEMISFMKNVLQKSYGTIFFEYLEKIMAKDDKNNGENANIGNTKIEIKYGWKVNNKPKETKYAPKEIAKCLEAYILEAKSFRAIEKEVLKRKSTGSVATRIIRDLGIKKEMKGKYKGYSIDEAINKAIKKHADHDKEVLEFIKQERQAHALNEE